MNSRTLLVAMACCAQALAAQAQPAPEEHAWSRGTSISGFAGVAGDSAQSGPLFGGTAGWDITPRVALDGSGAWAEYGGGFRAFSGAIKVRANLGRPGRARPFVQAGIGLYRAMFDRDAAGVPAFFGRRFHAAGMPARARSFTDPSLVFGGGVTLSLTRTLKLRPDVEFAVLARDSHRHIVSGLRLHLVYVFEHHPVTPSRRQSQ